MKHSHRSAVALILLFVGTSCATVDVTKTAKGFHPATDPDYVEILVTLPNREFIELATVSTTRWNPNETAKMHNALRSKAAPIGADAVVLTNSGVLPNGTLWSTGVAIRYAERPKP